jgi:RND family efflux transporter MFP subunit
MLGLVVFRFVSNNLAPIEAESEVPVNVRLATVEVADIDSTSILTGQLEAMDEVSVVPKTPGVVTSVYVSLGSKVSKGSTLFELDKTQLSISLSQARNTLDNAKVNYDRMKTLYEEGVMPLQTYEQAQSTLNMANDSYAAAADALASAVVTSPINGYVTSVGVVAGALASQAVPCVTISNTDKLEINTNLSESMINKLAIGDTVDVLIKSASDTPLQGVVTAISPAPVSGSLTYPVKVTLNNPDELAKAGMFAEVLIVTEQSNGVLAIPSAAVMIKSGRQVVATVNNDNSVSIRSVVVGIDDGEKAEIKEGLSEGERVVIEGQTYLDETSAVNIIE